MEIRSVKCELPWLFASLCLSWYCCRCCCCWSWSCLGWCSFRCGCGCGNFLSLCLSGFSFFLLSLCSSACLSDLLFLFFDLSQRFIRIRAIIRLISSWSWFSICGHPRFWLLRPWRGLHRTRNIKPSSRT